MGFRNIAVRGIVPAVVVPFKGDEVEWNSFERELAGLERSGADGISIGGGLGELAGVGAAGLRQITEFAARAVAAPVFVTILPDSEPEAFELFDAVVEGGATAVLVAQPHYLFQPGVGPLSSFFERLRSRARMPVLLANILHNAPLAAADVDFLVNQGVVDGVLQGGSDPHAVVDVLAAPPRVPVFCGVEQLAYTALLLGAAGIVSTMAALFPVALRDMNRAIGAGDHEKARRIHEALARVWATLDDSAEYCSRVRTVFSSQGLDIGSSHPPFDIESPATAAGMLAALERERGILLQ